MMKRRIFMSIIGVLLSAVAVGFFKMAAFGVDPFQSFMAGLNQQIPIAFGTLYMLVNALLLIFGLVTDRHNIGVATLINLFLLGYITQFTYAFLQSVFVNPAIWLRILFLLVGVVVLCFGSAFYMTANLGVSTYDAIAIVMANKWKLGKFQYIRIGTDLICVTLGILLFLTGGGAAGNIPTFVGVGTIITALFMGPLIALFNERVAQPFLNKPTRSN
jgi:uncharacterized membrane protein YczE